MADLFERCFPENVFTATNTISLHLLEAAVIDYVTGNTTRQQMINHWNLDPEAVTQLDKLLDWIDAKPTTIEKIVAMMEWSAVNIMAQEGLKYNTPAAYAARLGL